MTSSYTLTINGVDFHSKIKPYSYTTKWAPVASESVTTMDGVDHVTTVRWKGGVSFELIPMTSAELSTLISAFGTRGTVSVTYTSLQANSTKTETMKPTAISTGMVLKNASRTLVGGVVITMEAC